MSQNIGKKRLLIEYNKLQNSETTNFVAQYKETDIYEWHFCVYGLQDPQYAGGFYHGIVIFPPQYPAKPPAIMMITPSGRFKPKERICLTISDFHPETWNPTWRFESILVGLISFMLSEENSVGSLHENPEVRKELAAKSLQWNLENDADNFRQLFQPQFHKMGLAPDGSKPQTTNDGLPRHAQEEEKAQPIPQQTEPQAQQQPLYKERKTTKTKQTKPKRRLKKMVGNQAAGEQAVGNQAAGEQAVGNLIVGNQAVGNQAAGEQAVGNLIVGNQAVGNQTAGDQAVGNLIVGNQAVGNQTAGDQAVGNLIVGNQAVGNIQTELALFKERQLQILEEALADIKDKMRANLERQVEAMMQILTRSNL